MSASVALFSVSAIFAAKVLVYGLVVRWAIGLGWRRSAALAAVRVVVGAGLYWAVYAWLTPPFAVGLLVSAPLAWLAAAWLDTHRPRRVVRLVVIGTIASVGFDFAVFGALMGHQFFDSSSLRLING